MRSLRGACLPTAALLAAGCSGVQSVGDLAPLGGAAVQMVADRPQFTDADEQRMAQENARAFEAETPMWDDPLLEAYVTEITQRLVAVAHPRPFAYRVRVVRDPSVNAFTFGGGLLYVHAGLIARMENEAQLAMVLGHEIAHVTERHVPEGIERAYGIQLLGQIAATTASATGVLQGDALEQTYKYTMNAAVNGHGRAQEAEADEVGMEYMVKGGYDPREAPRTFEQLLKEYGDQSALENFFYGSHPTNRARIEHTTELGTRKYASEISGPPLVVDTDEFRQRTRGVVVATGILDYEQKRFNTARAMFEKAVSASPDDAVAHHYLGKLALETGPGVDEAVSHLLEAIRADARYAPAHRELGLAYSRQGDEQRALAAFEEYLRLDPGAEDAAQVRAMIEELRR